MLEFVVFLNCICIGVLTAAASGLSVLIKKTFKNNLLIDVALDFGIYLFGALGVFALSFKMYNGGFAVFEILGFLIGIVIAKNTCGNLFAKFFDMLYNSITKLTGKLSQTKLGKKLFK
ncbi:MAG: hypothetical protein IJW24_03850 [Clostridia bacterium]|nr:hypothetical protein [Clostridia bacterium]